MRIQIDGPDNATIAAELEAFFRSQSWANTRVAEPAVVHRDATAIVAVVLSLPSVFLAAAQLKDRLTQQTQMAALKAEITALKARYPKAKITPVQDAGEDWRW